MIKRKLIKRKPSRRGLGGPRRGLGAKKRSKSISRLKKDLEALQKQIVIKIYGRDCFTCPQKNLQGANCQLGHVPWPRSMLSTECKFDYEFTRIQCFRCNIHMGGMGAEAYERMLAAGVGLDAMRFKNELTKGKPYPRKWFESQIAEYGVFLSELQAATAAPLQPTK